MLSHRVECTVCSMHAPCILHTRAHKWWSRLTEFLARTTFFKFGHCVGLNDFLKNTYRFWSASPRECLFKRWKKHWTRKVETFSYKVSKISYLQKWVFWVLVTLFSHVALHFVKRNTFNFYYIIFSKKLSLHSLQKFTAKFPCTRPRYLMANSFC